MTHIYTNKAQIVSSCTARQCHPETCCCRTGEAAIMDYIPITSGFRKGETYYGVVTSGDRKELKRLLQLKPKNETAMESKSVNYVFMRNPVRLECFQMTVARRLSNEHWPIWLHLAWQKDRDEEGALQPTVVGDGKGSLSLSFENHNEEIVWGDWLVKEIDGTIRVYSSDLFNDSFLEDDLNDQTT